MSEKAISSWRDLTVAYSELKDEADRSGRRWLYRGERRNGRALKPTLERQTERFSLPLTEMRGLEERLLREFKRHYHRYSVAPPDAADDIRWLALVQHHGGPTRLLDFTYSFYAGVYFAVREAKPPCDAVLWLLDHDRLWSLLRSRLDPDLRESLDTDATRWKGPLAAKLLLGENRDGVMPVNPLDLDARLAVQQGVFLMPLDLSKSFATVLFDYLGKDHTTIVQKWNLRFSLRELRATLAELQRMNLNELSLFPDLDGLARNLSNMIGLPHLFVREDMDSRATTVSAT